MYSGGLVGLKRRATITKYNGDGTVTVKLNDATSILEDINTHDIQLPMAYGTQSGGFIGGYPEVNTQVMIEQGQGEWFISGFLKPDNIFVDGNLFGIGSDNPMGDLQPGRILIQSHNATNRIYLDTVEGIVSGDANNYQQQDPTRSILSSTYNYKWDFTLAHRSIIGKIKRDINENSVRNISGSPLTDHGYNDSLWTVGMDPDVGVSLSTSSSLFRNLALAENRSITYEFADDCDNASFGSDQQESNKYNQDFKESQSIETFKQNLRTDVFGLNLYYPNHLIEEIKGTGVDLFGNIIDINRNIIPIGQNQLTFTDNQNSVDAFRKIRAAHRKSLAYHFEINARKSLDNDAIYEVPSSSDRSNYARDRSTFFFDVDKEGQFKMNVPMSSEIGNVPLPTRYTNASVLAFEQEKVNNPNAYFIESDGVDIYTENFSSNYRNDTGISLIGSEGQVGPQDRLSKTPIKLNTTYHDITNAGQLFKKDLIDDGKIVPYMPNSRLNLESDTIQQSNIVTNEIRVSGEDANAGGRSGTISTDGFVNLNFGANTVDRQSLWLDTAGGIVATIGRDTRGISYCASLDGDMLVQIGGPGLGASLDDRFSNQPSGMRSGALDIRVISKGNQLTVIRVDEQGVNVTTGGRLVLESQQELVLQSNTNIIMEAPLITMYGLSMPRIVKRNGVEEI